MLDLYTGLLSEILVKTKKKRKMLKKKQCFRKEIPFGMGEKLLEKN